MQNNMKMQYRRMPLGGLLLIGPSLRGRETRTHV
jgi:hypothetical protein